MSAWAIQAETLSKLVRWASERLFVRRDVCGGYGPNGTLTLPGKKYRTGRDFVTGQVLRNHFLGMSVIGAHCVGLANVCLWVAWDVDRHDDAVDAAANWLIVQRIVGILVSLGLQPLVEDSNGAGGYHVWIILDRPVQSDLAYRFANWIKRRADAPHIEAFPKQDGLNESRLFGNWLRVPGPHHRRRHWSRFYDREMDTWAEGDAAIQAILNAPINDADELIRMAAIIPAAPRPVSVPLHVLPVGNAPTCVRDLEANSIRRCGDRNKGLLTLTRYWKLAGVPQHDAAARGIAWVRRIPGGLTSSCLSDGEIANNVQSVVASVYGGNYGFECWHARTLGVKCDEFNCEIKPMLPISVEQIPDGPLSIPCEALPEEAAYVS